MGRSRRLFGLRSAVVVTITLALASPDPRAGAQSAPPPSRSGGGGVHTGGSRTTTGAQVSVSGGQTIIPTSGRNHHRGGGRRTTVCSFATIDGIGAYGPDVTDLVPDTKVWRTCYDTATGQRVDGPTVYTVPVAGGAGPARPGVTQAMIDVALANIDIDLPRTRLSPPAVTLPNFDTWMWVADQPDDSASASAAGVTITVTAHLTSTRFSLGRGTGADRGNPAVTSRDDGLTVTCSGSGSGPQNGAPNGAPNAALGSTGCRHRFSAPSRDLTIDATSTWHIRWTATNGTSGDLGTVERTGATPYRVQERRTVIRTR